MRRTYEEIGFSEAACAIINETKNRTFVDIVGGELYTDTMLKDIITRFSAERASYEFDIAICEKVNEFSYQGLLVFNSVVYSFECENYMDLVTLKNSTTPEQLLKCIKSCSIKGTCGGATKSRIILFLSRYF